MKSIRLLSSLAIIASLLTPFLLGEEAAASATPAKQTAINASPIAAEFSAIMTRIREKNRSGKENKEDFAQELKDFEALRLKYKDLKSDDAAEVAVMQARLYLFAFGDFDTGSALLAKVKADYPGTSAVEKAQKTMDMIPTLKLAMEGKKIYAGLIEGKPFPDFDEKDLSGQPLSVSKYRGKVVLIDFWATWCGPCVAELPNVIAAYEKYHAKGFEIIGISLDRDRAKLDAFLSEQKMTWAQYFDGHAWRTKLAVKYGIQSIPATYLLDGTGVIIARDLRGEDLEKHLEKLLGGK